MYTQAEYGTSLNYCDARGRTSEAVPAPNPLQNLYPQERVQAGLCLAPPYSNPATDTSPLVCVTCQVALNPAFTPMNRHFQRNAHRERTFRPLGTEYSAS